MQKLKTNVLLCVCERACVSLEISHSNKIEQLYEMFLGHTIFHMRIIYLSSIFWLITQLLLIFIFNPVRGVWTRHLQNRLVLAESPSTQDANVHSASHEKARRAERRSLCRSQLGILQECKCLYHENTECRYDVVTRFYDIIFRF